MMVSRWLFWIGGAALAAACGGEPGIEDETPPTGETALPPVFRPAEDLPLSAPVEGGSEPAAAAPAAQPPLAPGRLLPLAVGARWAYRIRALPGARTAVAGSSKVTMVEGIEDVGVPKAGIKAFRVRTATLDGTLGSSINWDEDRGAQVVRHRERRLAANGSIITDASWFPAKVRVQDTPDGLRVGAAWTADYQEVAFSAKGNLRVEATRRDVWKVESLGDLVKVPAGEFRSVRIRLSWLESSQEDGHRRGEKLYWFAPGVGKVAEAAADRVEELTSFSLPRQP